MKNFVFLDTETTGNDLVTDRLFQVCYSFDGKIYSEYFKPLLPISVKAQSITHVTNKMVALKSAFAGSKMQKDLQKILKDNILVAHNAQFDICMLSHEGIDVQEYICTLKVARFLDEKNNIPEYNLQFLRYFLEIEVEAAAHDATGDVIVLEALFNNLLQQMTIKYGSVEAAIEKMIEVSKTPSLFKKIPFGKHKGRFLSEVVVEDKEYLLWLLNEKILKDPEDEDWIFTLQHYLGIKA